MPRSSPSPNRRRLVLTLLLLFAVSGLEAQTAPSISLPGSQSPFTGSEPEGKATPEVLQLSFQEAIERGLRNNLRSEEHTSELQSHLNLVCRLLLEKKKKLTSREVTTDASS